MSIVNTFYFWSAHKCVDKFKALAKNSFRKLLISSIPLVGYLALWTDSYYDKSAIEKELKRTISAPDGRPRFLLDELYAPHQQTSTCNSTPSVRDIKLGVTTVNAITYDTKLITNYNRKTSNGEKDDHGPPIYREDSRDMEMMVWEAARCTSAAPYMFPAYRAKDGRAYQDGGLNENNPIGLAVKGARFLCPQECRVDVALSIGTDWTDERIAEYNSLHAHVVHGWLKRCVDSFKSKLDSERLWQEYRQTLDEEGRTRRHRLNTKLPNTLPFMGDTSAIEMDPVTTTSRLIDEDVQQREILVQRSNFTSTCAPGAIEKV
ncbi:hypothetical protein DPV78_005072 [Talaromyces pinophilus]|nr:hypothetical protein DPV78_005072 [Talaromyces pinophilus]